VRHDFAARNNKTKRIKMKTKYAVGIVIIGLALAATLFVAKKQSAVGVYTFNRASDGVRFTCDLRANGVYFGSLEIPGTNYSAIGGDIPAALTRSGNGATGAHGLEGKWEVRHGKVYLFIDGHKSGTKLVIQDRSLVTPDGFTYVRAEKKG
jgi:hypothetical protein